MFAVELGILSSPVDLVTESLAKINISQLFFLFPYTRYVRVLAGMSCTEPAWGIVLPHNTKYYHSNHFIKKNKRHGKRRLFLYFLISFYLLSVLLSFFVFCVDDLINDVPSKSLPVELKRTALKRSFNYDASIRLVVFNLSNVKYMCLIFRVFLFTFHTH